MSKSPKKPKEKGPDIAGLLLTGRFFSQLCEAPTGTPAADESERSRLVYFSECGTSAQKSWILKGLIARGETSAWIGPPKAAKSAFVTDMSVHAAACLAWQGHKAKEACGVLILALERADLTRRRLHAYAMREGHKDLPIAVHGGIIDMMNPACVDLIVQLVREAEAHLARPVGIIIIDTFNKGIAVGGGDEDKARDQNRAAANLRRLHELLPVYRPGRPHG
jgi:hypothetical protein